MQVLNPSTAQADDMNIKLQLATIAMPAKEILKATNTAITACKKAHAAKMHCGRVKIAKQVRRGSQGSQGVQGVPSPSSRASQILLELAAKEDFDSIGFTENGDDVLALRNPVFEAFSFEAFTAFSQTSGLVPHIKWLQKQVGENRSTAMSPFQTKIHKRILAALSSALPGLYPKVTVAAMHEPLRATICDVQALVMTSTHVYHGLPAYGVTQAVYLLGGVCSMFGAPVSTLAGETIKQKVDGLIFKDSGTFLTACLVMPPETGLSASSTRRQDPLSSFRPDTFLSFVAATRTKTMVSRHFAGACWTRRSAKSWRSCTSQGTCSWGATRTLLLIITNRGRILSQNSFQLVPKSERPHSQLVRTWGGTGARQIHGYLNAPVVRSHSHLTDPHIGASSPRQKKGGKGL